MGERSLRQKILYYNEKCKQIENLYSSIRPQNTLYNKILLRNDQVTRYLSMRHDNRAFGQLRRTVQIYSSWSVVFREESKAMGIQLILCDLKLKFTHNECISH